MPWRVKGAHWRGPAPHPFLQAQLTAGDRCPVIVWVQRVAGHKVLLARLAVGVWQAYQVGLQAFASAEEHLCKHCIRAVVLVLRVLDPQGILQGGALRNKVS